MISSETVIVTGGSSGLGYQCSKSLAGEPHRTVIIASRNLERSEKAANEISKATGNGNVIGLRLDLESFNDVRAFCENFRSMAFPPLTGLVCNAGIQTLSTSEKTVDGFEKTFALNHLGHFLLVRLLLQDFRTPAKIVIVSSGTHDPAQKTGMPAPHFADLSELASPPQNKDSDGLRGRRAYTNSKLCNVFFAYELSRRIQAGELGLQAKNISVNAFDPGLMPGSGLAREYNVFARLVWKWIMPALRFIIKNVNSTEESGRNLARLLTDPSLNGTTGKYFEGTKEIPSSKESYDSQKAAKVWSQSCQLVGLTS